MKLKDKIITFVICLIVISLYVVIASYNYMDNDIKHVYNVYLNNEVIGSITNEDDLYAMINRKQSLIKQRYNVDNVYPPENLKVVENYSYDAKITSIDSIYNKIEELQDFTILGYEVTFSAYKGDSEEDENNHDAFNVYILDKQILNDALEEFILAFIEDEEDFNNYMKGTQGTLEEIGTIYEKLDILEDITIREKYISVNEKIYENSEELAQDLLFGFNHEENRYTVKEGDTIEKIAEANKLNKQEFLIANPKYTSEQALLTIGEQVNVTLINPEISFSAIVLEMKEEEEDYNTVIERDNTQAAGYEEIKFPGVKGLSLQTKRYTNVNGETLNDVELIGAPTIIREKVDRIIVKGRQSSGGSWGKETETYIGSGWLWPTEVPYSVTSEYDWRWGKMHNGIDISGTPADSHVLAANDGVVVKVNTSCSSYGGSHLYDMCGSGYGNYVVIDHGNNIFTIYGHMLQNVIVKVGQNVKMGDYLGFMGNSGSSTGRHLHFGYSIGDPLSGGKFKNPRELFPR